MAAKITRSSGNVFKDLGFSASEAAHLRVRADLMIQLHRVIHDRGLKQAEAAKLFRISQPRVSDLMKGKVDLFSVDTLIEMLAQAGFKVRLDFSMMRLCKGEPYFESGLGEHVDQRIDTEEVDLALLQVPDPGLTDAEQLCGFGLFESSIMNNPVQLNHQVGPDPKMRGLRCGEAEVLEHVSTRSRDFGGHGFLSASWCCVVSLPVL